jgi:hypothetical protein
MRVSVRELICDAVDNYSVNRVAGACFIYLRELHKLPFCVFPPTTSPLFDGRCTWACRSATCSVILLRRYGRKKCHNAMGWSEGMWANCRARARRTACCLSHFLSPLFLPYSVLVHEYQTSHSLLAVPVLVSLRHSVLVTVLQADNVNKD